MASRLVPLFAAVSLIAIPTVACSLFESTDLSGEQPDRDAALGDDATAEDATAADALGSDGASSETSTTSDGGDANAPGFTISVKQPHVTADPNDQNIAIDIDVSRTGGFAGAIDVKFNALPAAAGISGVNPLILTDGVATGPISFDLDSAAVAGDYTIEVIGQSGAVVSNPAHFALRVGSGLASTGADMSVPLPAWATAVDVVMWGAGGGGGAVDGTAQNTVAGGGGAGGFLKSRVPVSGGVTLDLVVGTPGSPGTGLRGGGGGGYSAVKVGSVLLAVAGGGGGGGYGGTGSPHDGAPGHASGAPPCQRGQDGTDVAGGAGGGTTTIGAAGMALMGGGSGSGTLGGSPGGGRTSTSGGGGGGGYFGGGQGGACATTFGGGGGGSGYAIAGSTGTTLLAGTGSNPPGTNEPDYVSPIATGGQPGAYSPTQNALSGKKGWIVVRLAKP